MKRKPRVPTILVHVLIHGSLVLLGAMLWLLISERPGLRTGNLLTNHFAAPLAHSNHVVDAYEAPPAGLPAPREELVGIGAILKKDSQTGDLLILGSVPGSPAAEAGLAGNFIVRQVDDVAVEGLSLQECIRLMRGASGTSVRLTLFNAELNEERTVELTRRKIQVAVPKRPE